MCGWLIIFLGQTFWLSSNSSDNVVTRNCVGASVAADAVEGEVYVGSETEYGDGDSDGARARSGAGAGA